MTCPYCGEKCLGRWHYSCRAKLDELEDNNDFDADELGIDPEDEYDA